MKEKKKIKKVKRISKRGKNYVQFANGILIYLPKTMMFGKEVTLEGILPRSLNKLH